MAKDRAIKLAFDKESNLFLDAEELFANTRNAFATRKRYSQGKLKPWCYECDQPLHIATSKFDRLFFRHGPNAGNCLLKDQDFTPDEILQYNNTLQAKESERHYYLKHKIAKLLKDTPGVEADSVFADTRYLFYGTEKRRPDVYCRYKGKEMVFEIQLSALSQRYLLDRHEFYRSKGIYLVWILDTFDVQGQSHTERDIKYLSSFQNFFKLDETSAEMRLICTYKSPYITDKNQLITPWQTRSLTLDQLQFCTSELQLYYLDFAKKLLSEQQRLADINTEIRKKELEAWKLVYNQRCEQKAVELIGKIGTYKKKTI